MKRLLIAVFAMFLLFASFYMVGVFIENSFNLSRWSINSRIVVGILGCPLSIFFGAFTYFNYDDFKK